jgi:hypothetical protein
MRHMKWDNVAEKKRREAETTSNAKGSVERPTGQPSGRQPISPGGETSVFQKAPQPPRARAKPTSWTRPIGRFHGTCHEAPGPLSGAGFAPLPAQANRSPAQGPVVKPTASTSEQAASSSRQLSYAEAGAQYDGEVAGRPVKGETAGVDSSAPLPVKKGHLRRVKVGGTRRTSRSAPLLADTWEITPPRQKAKWDSQAHSQGYQHCSNTRCFDGSSTKAHLSRST